MNFRKIYGNALKEYAKAKLPLEKIGCWAFCFYWDYIEEIDSNFEDVLLALNKMELGPEFYYSYEELEKIADDLIAGKEVVL